MQQQTKVIGLIGGMGWESSKLYYERINHAVNVKLGGSHSAKIILVSVDFSEIERHTSNRDWKAIERIMVKSAQQLERAGADMVLLCTNLIHLVSPAIIADISIPFLHIADATGRAIAKKQLKKVLLLGTKPTMELDFYTSVLENKYDLDITVPNPSDMQIIHDIIYGELLKGVFTETSKQRVIEMIQNSKSNGIEGVIMGCTELPMLVQAEDISIPLFDTGQIHADQAVAFALT
ncbi:amino acid racemase [Aureisphaera galaxeae]|uniref:aspartate/glutamate racemase family protein n=1 Tax=Aureisphaera galaxeae TaxID=1538023 RepID=UPI00234FC720|nr:amino acid racemase [Aureisphaera galaxeae]MDC8004334.1 amino acid racemase [Aureisphaera galaxeae]